MKRFIFHSPTHLIFKIGGKKEISKEAIKFGKRVLFIVDYRIRDITRNIEDDLKKLGLEVIIYDKITKEPTLEKFEEVANFARESKVNLVIGVGGGSTMDTAKIASAALTNDIPIKNMIGIDKVPNKGVPLILSPTTAGTGSEVNRTAMVIVNSEKTWVVSKNIAADIAIVDPELTVTCPPKVTAVTGMDALSHAIEGYMSLDSNPIVEGLTFEVVRLVERSLRRAYYNGNDIKARSDMSFAATLGGLILCSTAATYGHSISYTLVKYGIPHGLGTGFALPYAMEINLPVIPEKLALIGEAFGVYNGTVREKAQAAIECVRSLLRDLNMPLNLQELDIPKDDLKLLAKELIEKYPRKNNPRQLTFEDSLKLYKRMWEGP